MNPSMNLCPKPLFYEMRGDQLDNIHMGYLAVVDENGRTIFSVGDPESVVYLRSSAKPIQALPVIARRLDEEYGITPRESAIIMPSRTISPRSNPSTLKPVSAKMT